jgi:tetratricopeptide (TPR) repeat protein
MTVRPVAILAVFAVVAVLTVGAASAQADPDARAQAAAHVRQGQAFFQRDDFDRALAEFQTAFDLSAEPLLIFNIALCHDRAYRPEQALQAFQRYLELAPSGSVADEARSDVARLTPIVEQRAAARAAETQRQRTDANRRADADRRANADRRRVEAAHRRTWLARGVMVAGAVVVGGAAVTHAVAWRTRDRAAHDRDPEIYFRDRHALMIERDVAYGAYAVGGVVLATGLVLALTARSTGEGAQLSAGITPGGATLSVAWSR